MQRSQYEMKRGCDKKKIAIGGRKYTDKLNNYWL